MENDEWDFSFKKLFVPLTTFKAIHWIVIVGIIVYFNMLFNGFVWDDTTYIHLNPEVHTLNFSKIIGPSVFNSSGYYRPIPAFYFSLLYSFFNENTFFYHFFQLILHISTTSLLFILFKKFFNSKLSLFLSLIFLVHPMQVESVSFIAQTVSPLFFLFGIIALLLSINRNISKQRFIAIFAIAFSSLLTKETGILFFFIILLYKFIFDKKQIRIFLMYESLLVLLYFLVRFTIGGVYFSKINLIPIARLPFFERLMNIPAIIFYYIKTFFYPKDLIIEQHWVVTKIDFQNFYLPFLLDLLFFTAIGLLALYLIKKNEKTFHSFLFFFFWFIGGLFMHLQIFPLDMTVADRWFYLPLVGLLGMIGTGLQVIKFTNRKLLAAGYMAGIFLLILLSVRTMVRNENWKDPITLFTHDLQIQDNFDIQNGLAAEYGAIGNYKEALLHAERSAKLFPSELNYYNIGQIYEKLGDIPYAEKYYYKAIAEKSYIQSSHAHYLLTYQRLSFLLLQYDTPEKSKEFVMNALTDYPDSWQLWMCLALVKYKIHDKQGAIDAAKKVLQYNPTDSGKSVFTYLMNNESYTFQQLQGIFSGL